MKNVNTKEKDGGSLIQIGSSFVAKKIEGMIRTFEKTQRSLLVNKNGNYCYLLNSQEITDEHIINKDDVIDVTSALLHFDENGKNKKLIIENDFDIDDKLKKYSGWDCDKVWRAIHLDKLQTKLLIHRLQTIYTDVYIQSTFLDTKQVERFLQLFAMIQKPLIIHLQSSTNKDIDQLINLLASEETKRELAKHTIIKLPYV